MTIYQGVASRQARVLLLACACAVMSLTGVQLVAPALPEIQTALKLTDSQVALFSSLFLTPGVVLSTPIGMAADRFGRRVILCGALLVLGLGGIALLMIHNIHFLLAVRLLQGVAFAAIIPTTITIIGDVLAGTEQIRAQGYRTVAMAGGEAALPLVGGGLAAIAWFAPFAVQAIAIPLAVISWLWLGEERHITRTTVRLRDVGPLIKGRVALSLQAAGLLRFFFKFAVWSYAPLILSQRGMSTSAISVSLSIMAIATAVAAWSAYAFARRCSVAILSAACLVSIAVAFLTIALTKYAPIAVLSLLILGWSDGLYGVLQNAIVGVSVSREIRATFVAMTASVRNFGKFAAPTVIGGLVVLTPLNIVFALLGLLSLISAPSSLAFRRVDSLLHSSAGNNGSTPTDERARRASSSQAGDHSRDRDRRRRDGLPEL